MGSILISMMFNENKGSYALQWKNIVHETINLLTADDGKNYFYVVPRGEIKGQNKADTLVKRAPDYLLLVRAYSTNIVQVVALVHNPHYRFDDVKNRKEVLYGGKSLLEIFGDNTENDNQYITFEADKVLVPKELMLIASYTEKNDVPPIIERGFSELRKINKKIRNQSMRLYLSNGAQDAEYNYNIILGLIKKEELWKPANYSKVCDIKRPELNLNFMNVIGMEDSELAFSNMFAYFFSNYPTIFGDFIRSFSDIRGFDISKLIIEREKNRIDLFATDGYWHIIIENKIKSGINGVTVDKDDKNNGKLTSQLSKYIASLTNPKKNDDTDKISESAISLKQIRCFLFQPDYSRIKLDKFKDGEKYCSVAYSELYAIFNKYADSDIIKPEDKAFFSTFLKAMIKHTKNNDTDIEDRMIARFIDRINSI